MGLDRWIQRGIIEFCDGMLDSILSERDENSELGKRT